MTQPPQTYAVDIEGAPTITIAEKPWPVPKLAPKQARHVVPALMGILPLVGRVQAATTNDGAGLKVDTAMLMDAMAQIDQPTYDRLITAVYWAMKRGTPGLGLGEFEEMPVDLFEMLNALPVIMKQTGFIKQRSGNEPAGEAPAVDQSTGIS